ncbi:MAG: TldD/PmbA family protein, partial [Candidatus Hodarchaeales archaeon]
IIEMTFSKELLFEKGQFVLKEAEKLGATQAEVAIELRTEALTRLANSIVDQNVAEKHAKFRITLYYGKQKGDVTVEVFDNNSIEKAVLNASKIAKASSKNEDFKSIPESQPYSTKLGKNVLVSKATLDATPEQRAENAKLAIGAAHDVDKTIKAVAGAISNATVEKAIANSLGIEAYQASTQSRINLTILAKKGEEEAAGWSADFRRDFSELRVREVSEIAARKAANGFGMKALEPGDYEVVLEPAAVAGLNFYLGFYGFSALFHHDHRTFLKDKIGEKVFSEKLDLWSDPLNEKHVLASMFDDEGVPTQKLDLIKEGVVTNIAYNTLTAGKDGVESTGHNYYSRFFRRPIPLPDHLFVREGDSSLEEMIAETKNGILITHFHYQNLVNAGKGVCTGLTRDGTWLIQNGEITYPVKTLRYTDSIARFFKDIDLVGQYQDLNDTSSIMMSAIVPPMKLPSFVFTGSSEK